MDDPAITVDDVEAARERIAGQVVETPTTFSRTLSDLTGAYVFIKFENLQFTASFKERGALNRLLTFDEEVRARGVVTASAGNHAQSLAHHAGRLGVPATIVMPEHTPNVKVSRTAALGAEIVLSGRGYDEAAEAAATLADERGLTDVPAFDDAEVIAGQGTVALEMLDAVDDLDVLVVPVGGGGLISGMAIVAAARSIEVIGVQAAAAPAMVDKLAGRATQPGMTVADGIAVKRPGALTVPLVQRLVDDVIVVSEAAIEEAMGLYLEVEKTVAEGAGAAALAALLEHGPRFANRRVGVVLSGGNVDLRLLSTAIARLLTRSGRLVRIRAVLDDVPGSLATLAGLVGEAGGNIVEVEHRRDLPGIDLRRTDIELAVEARDHDHVAQLIRALEDHGIMARVDTGG